MDANILKAIHERLIEGIKSYFKKSGLDGVVVGVSGGIDSALTLKLAVDALGAEKVAAISMPEIGLSSKTNQDHAKQLCKALGVKFFVQPINQFLGEFHNLVWSPSKIATQNTKARIRAVLLYNFANSANTLVLGTSNRSEILLGYGTKYGDLAADLEVIGDLYKEEVFALADYLGLPKEIIEKAPSAELFPGQTDEAELGASYSQIDPILMRMEMGAEKLIERGVNPTLFYNIQKRIEKNKHKSEMPPVITIARGDFKIPENA